MSLEDFREELKTTRLITVPGAVYIDSLSDFCGSLAQLRAIIDEKIDFYGDDALVQLDAGANNVEVVVVTKLQWVAKLYGPDAGALKEIVERRKVQLQSRILKLQKMLSALGGEDGTGAVRSTARRKPAARAE
ncbi:hypothetical protein [Ralstonia phage phiRSL1]|uniref:Uncharacterized protein n=1 Tax=Ralstonia phage phiRSL1 TaxID=1980924 RepID=B2ZY76_9CAUD|nr:hypothetical protein RSL1_ORF264 [Ralstonia phage phiRSL1]BAG41711.1 hypothetical protein [Ralstonia phage phiRSL1]